MTSRAGALESAAQEVAVTLPTPQQTWLGRLVSRLAGPRSPRKTSRDRSPLPRPSQARLDESQAESSFSTSSVLPPTVLYLAYGSNLCYETFQGRRGIRPISAVNVVVPELSLAFDLPGVPYIEPCFANSAHRKHYHQPAPGRSVMQSSDKESLLPRVDTQSVALVGVVYEVTGKDYHRIIATEGPAYTDVVVECHALSGTTTAVTKMGLQHKAFKAHTLLAPPQGLRQVRSSGPAQPSLRYLTLCRTGAREHKLPMDWQDYLNGLQHYHTTSVRQVIGKAIFVLVWGPIVLLSFGIRRVFGGKDGNASPAIKTLTQSVFRAMWISYDKVFKHVFGDGERTQIR